MKRIAIVGAGRVGVRLAEELLNNEKSCYIPVCFIDIERSKIGREIHDIPVVDESNITHSWLLDHKIEELVFAMPSMDVKEKTHLYETYKDFEIPIKIYDFPLMRVAGSKRQLLFFAEANWRMLQNELNGKNCKTALGATPPNPCKIGHFITLKGNVINYPILALFSKSGLQYSPFYFCNKQVVALRSWLYARRIDNGCQTEEFPRSLHL